MAVTRESWPVAAGSVQRPCVANGSLLGAIIGTQGGSSYMNQGHKSLCHVKNAISRNKEAEADAVTKVQAQGTT